MNADDFQRRLCEISTHWTAVVQAHRGSTSAADAAHAELFQRYGGAVFRYLLGAVRDFDAAEELSHEFVLRLVRGDFHRVDPQRGRFRDYIKTVLINLVNDYHRSQRNQPRALESAAPDPAAPYGMDSADDGRFEGLWRQELLERTWTALNEARPNYYAVLRLRVDNPDMPAREIAHQLADQLEKSLPPETVRKTLERARAKFADLLVDEVALSLSSSDYARVEAELKELELLRYCSAALQRKRGSRGYSN